MVLQKQKFYPSFEDHLGSLQLWKIIINTYLVKLAQFPIFHAGNRNGGSAVCET